MKSSEKNKKGDHGTQASFRWGRFLFLGVGGIVFSAFGLHTLFMSSYFQVKTIKWQGIQRVDAGPWNARFAPLIGTSLIYLDVSKLHSQLVTDPWIKEVMIRKVLPGQIDVLVTERVPVAVEIDPKTRKRVLRDSDGKILHDGGASAALPRIIHYNAQAFYQALPLLSLLSKRRDAVIDLASMNDLRVYLPREGGRVRIGNRDYQKRWERFIHVEKDLHRRRIQTWEADLRFPSRVVVRTGPIGETPPSAQGAI